jgi:hypothetical protein
MTLLIGTVSDNNVVITADGLSRVNPATGAGIECDGLQKIFPVAGLPVAFAHHGLNILGGKPIREFVESYITAHAGTLTATTIIGIARDLGIYGEDNVREVLADPANTGVVGFWIAGFGAGTGRPELYEICVTTQATCSKVAGMKGLPDKAS